MGEVGDVGKSAFAFMCWGMSGWRVSISTWLEETDMGRQVKVILHPPPKQEVNRVNGDYGKSHLVVLSVKWTDWRHSK